MREPQSLTNSPGPCSSVKKFPSGRRSKEMSSTILLIQVHLLIHNVGGLGGLRIGSFRPVCRMHTYACVMFVALPRDGLPSPGETEEVVTCESCRWHQAILAHRFGPQTLGTRPCNKGKDEDMWKQDMWRFSEWSNFVGTWSFW